MTGTLPDPEVLAAVFATLLAAGVVKGTLGIGLPAVSMSVLPFLIEPALAVTLLSLPILVTNAQQVVTVPGWRGLVRPFWPAAAAVLVSIFLVSLNLGQAPARLIGLVVGLSLAAFALAGLARIRLPVSLHPGWQVLAGVLAGITGGLGAVKSPVLIYCAALDLPRDHFVAAVGFLFFAGGLGLVGGLSAGSLLNPVTLPLSALALGVVMAGFQIGAVLRRRIDGALFRRLLLVAMLLLGVRMVAVSLVAA